MKSWRTDVKSWRKARRLFPPTALELSMKEATAWVMEGHQGLVDPERATYYIPSTEQTPVTPMTPGSARSGPGTRLEGPHPP